MGLYDHQNSGARLQHAADGSYSLRPDQADADKLIGVTDPQTHIMKASFVWDLPDLKGDGGVVRAIGLVVNDWQLSGIWTGSMGGTYTVSASYNSGGSSTNLTGSPNYGARVRVVGDPGSGCSGVSPVQYGGIPGPARRQRRPRVGLQLHERLFRKRARPVHRAEHPARSRPRHPIAGRLLQRTE
jgi:hypothetical protein